MTDFASLDDEALAQLRADVLNEIERRDRIALIPEQIASLKARFVEDGGDPADLT